MMYWIYDYPSWAIGLLFVTVFVGVTWIGIFATRATVHSWVHRENGANDIVGIALSSFFVLFGLLLGLVAVATYQNYSSVGDIVDKECFEHSRALSRFRRPPAANPRPFAGPLAGIHPLTTEEGGRCSDGASYRPAEPTGSRSFPKFWFTFEPSNRSEEIIHAEALRHFDNVVELRRARLANVTLGLPAVLWWVVAVGALLNIILIWLQDMEIHVHLILGGVLASILVLVIFLIAALDNPFRGEVNIGPDSIALVYETFMKPGVIETQLKSK
jgi:hypothetical protein